MKKRAVLVVGVIVCAASSSAQTFRPLGADAVVNVGPQTAGPRFASADVTGDGLPDLVLGLADNRNFEGDHVPDPGFVLASTTEGGLVNATASTFCGRAGTRAVSFNGITISDSDGEGRTAALSGNRPAGVLKARFCELPPDEPAPSRSWVLPSSARSAPSRASPRRRSTSSATRPGTPG